MILRPADTIPEMLNQTLARMPNSPAISFWDRSLEAWRHRTWAEFAQDVAQVTRVLEGHPVARRTVVTILENGYPWLVIDMALQICDAIHVPLNPALTPLQVNELVNHSSPSLIVADSKWKTKLASNVGSGGSNANFVSIDEWLHQGLIPADRTADIASPGITRLTSRDLDPEQVTTILYTSGTSGEPKGVMLSQRNLSSNVYAKIQTLPLGPSDRRVAWLPFTHIFGRVCDLYTAYFVGCHTTVSRGRDFLFEELKQFRPTYLNGVPLFYERCYRQLAHEKRLREPGSLLGLLGGSIALCNCGGAPLSEHLDDFFTFHSVELVAGYGLTETSPVLTSNRPGARKKNSVGQTVPGVQIKITLEDSPDGSGEVLAKGPNVMLGYFRDEQATQAALQDGWFRTGDIGRLDDEGFLFLTDRKKNIIVTSGGKNIAPVTIEARLLADPLIDQVVVFGDRQDFLTALVVVNQETARTMLPDWNGDPNSDSLGRYLRDSMDRRLRDLSRFEQIRQFRALTCPFDLESGTMTTKGSLRRQQIANQFRDLLEEMATATVQKQKIRD